MAVSKEEFEEWKENGKKIGATYLISVCDTFCYEDYPVYVMPHENINTISNEYRKGMLKVNEIVKL